MNIITLREVDERVLADFTRLVPQMEATAPPLTCAHLAAVAAGPATLLLAAREGPRVVGALTLACYPLPSGRHAWIEDVVVDGAARGRGVGEALVREALAHARGMGVPHVDLTCRPEREAASRLYRRMGFQTRPTHVYRYPLGPGEPAAPG